MSTLPVGVPGRLVGVGSRSVRILESDGGTGPLVVFDAGAGGSSDSWFAVLKQLPSQVRWMAYDRPGLLFTTSDAASESRLPSTIAHDLARLLDAIGEKGKVILVGHSRGGLHTRVFAALYPDRVAGLVQVDPSHERMLDESASSANRSTAKMQKRVFAVMEVALKLAERLPSWTGARKLYLSTIIKPEIIGPLGLSAQHLKAMKSAYLSDAATHAIRLEMTRLGPSLDETLRLAGALTVPVTVLSGSYMRPDGKQQGVRDMINALHADVVVRPGEQVVVERAGHMIPMDRPDAVVDAVLKMRSLAS